MLHVVLALLSLLQGVHATCCATCLAQPLVAAVDAVNWTACSAAQQVCCFDCAPSDFGTPTYVTTAVTFESDGARVPSGEYLQLSWPGAVAVKYLMLRKGQPKTAQVTNTSSAATFATGYFGLCPLFEGSIYLRAFDASGCSASLEMAVTVTPGSGSCANAIPTAPPTVTSVPCDPVRGAVTNGTCSCLQDFTGPPACLENSPWKQWGQILTYCAGGASFITAVFGFYRLWKQRQLHQHEAAVMDQSPASSDASPLDKAKEQHRSIETPLCGPTLLPLQSKTVRDDSRASSDGSSISEIYVAGDLRFHRGMDSPERNSREFSL
ncbi:hypothetical protein SPRG_13143 [Saprolegnia parasitica CBS 223.65]|uniref:EGF-like domain-containing protein n=1 Tax=Saprolegnia parasitica (strain CBS 223.65) TaxID=695850 RepID=A0A067C4L1_SAPPC|nr:hypothetical protein SPRG_13143 [Saprolegnia parasitica CBS 223.65]KDO21727.1 hypothetical protein SPRG_13143 [Saprolegnia parasitica CBS 223.65]|eukprot:XP_012207530.1 hypothetical protein SPRG_13143 [Saprolegnia parasitica CBS 223.65]